MWFFKCHKIVRFDMTKGEVLNQYGLRMIRKDLNEEADEQFVEFVKVLAKNFEEIYNENEESEV